MSDSTAGEAFEFPVSATQATFWYMYQMDPSSTAYSIPLGFRIRGPLNADYFRQALEAVVQRHEILRTRYREMDAGKLVQYIESGLKLPFEAIELPGSSKAEKEQHLDELLEQEFHRPVLIDKEPVLRGRLYSIAPDDNVFLIVAHHIAFDHMAFGLLLEEMAQNYSRLVAGDDVLNAEPELQYADYVIWQNEQVSGPEAGKQLEAWTLKLKPFSGVLDLPTALPRPKFQTFSGRDHYFSFSPETSRLVREFSKQRGLSLFFTMLACLKALYQRYSGQSDIIIGTPFSDRNQDESLEQVLGCFINTLPLATLFTEGMTFSGLLAQVKGVMMDAYENQVVPLEEIVHSLGLKRDPSRTPLFQVGFVFQEPPMSFSLPDASVSVMELPNFGAMYDIHTFMWDAGDVIGGVVTANSDLFDDEFVSRFLATFENATCQLIQNPDTEIQKVPMLSDSDRDLLNRVNQTSTPFSRESAVFKLVQDSVAEHGTKVAVCGSDGELTYEQLDTYSTAFAHHLVTQGVAHGDLVGVAVDRGSRMLVALLGIWKAGAAYVPLDPEYPEDRLAYMMQTANISMLVTQSSLDARIPKHACTRVLLDDDWDTIVSAEPDKPLAASGGEDIAYVIFTSGSTGNPKGVQISHRAAVNFLQSMAKRPGIKSDDRLLAVTTLSFDISVLELFLPLTVGATTVIATSQQSGDGKELLRMIRESRISIMQATPSTWRLMLAEGWFEIDEDWSAFTALCGGEAFPFDLARTLAEGVGSVWNMYGPTETTVWSACKRLDASNLDTRIGTPIDNTGIHVLNEAGLPVPIGVPGALHISGDGLSTGYLGRDDLTEQRFFRLPTDQDTLVYETGDLVRMHSNGELEYLHRLDGQVKLRGFRIELGEIESVLSDVASVAGVVANIWDSGYGDQRLVAYVIPKKGKINAIQLRKALRARLPDYMIPQNFVEMKEFPMTANGKIDRKSLPSPIGLKRSVVKEAPKTDTEKQVAAIWAEILGEKQVFSDDHFFDIGGHSLLAVKVIAMIEKSTGIRLNPRLIVMQPLSEIAREIEESAAIASKNN